jgi:exo-1,4-beta-D-glucosaminidase
MRTVPLEEGGHCVLRMTSSVVTVAMSVIVGAAALAVVDPPSGATEPVATAASHSSQAAVSASGQSTTSTLGLQGWQVLSSAKVTQSRATISSPAFRPAGWMHVTPDDAGAPGTEINALLENRACPRVEYGENMRRCFGYLPFITGKTTPEFAMPWWYRTEFSAHLHPGQHAQIVVNGIVGSADLWVNGIEVATHATLTGAYARTTYDVSRLLRQGPNALAFEIYPNDPLTTYSLDDVDWNQVPPDNNTGIQFPVQMEIARGLQLSDLHVLEDNSPTLSRSALTIVGRVTNSTGVAEAGTVTAQVTGPSRQGHRIRVDQQVTVPPRTTSTVTFSPATHPNLVVEHPHVWWPYQMGGQPLYTVTADLTLGHRFAGSAHETFGIRTVTSTLVGASSLAPEGVRRFSINGVPITIRGAAFGPDLFLHYSSRDTANQIRLLKGLGLDAIRLEGHHMPEDFYDQMDRAGIMIDEGFQCCDSWAPTSDAALTPQDLTILYQSALRLAEDVRNHPSVINYSWSDNAPTPRQESVSLLAFTQAGLQVPVISSAEYNASPQLGVSGEKEGPYDWVPPSYWYDTTHSSTTPAHEDPTLTMVGGSWGFASEQSAGYTVPTVDSINRFLTPADKSALWRDPDHNQYHSDFVPIDTGNFYGTMATFDAALEHRYGAWNSLSTYVEKAQLQGYEVARAQFEAFIDHSTNTPTPATGTIYWMGNRGFPTLLWDLYNSDYDESGTYFGAAEANRTLHALYAYDTGTVTVDNLSRSAASGLTVETREYDLAGHVLDDRTSATLSLASQQVRTDVLDPPTPPSTSPPVPARLYFIELILRKNGQQIDRNVYWLSTQADVVNWAQTVGNPRATMTTYANLTPLSSLPPVSVKVTAVTHRRDNLHTTTTVTLKNSSTSGAMAFFLRADVRRGSAQGRPDPGDNEVLPIVWNDDDITLWPGESETITSTYSSAELQGHHPVVTVSGWNVPLRTVASG